MICAIAGACGDNFDHDERDAGSCVPVDDGNPCTADLCENGAAVHPAQDPGHACPAGVCDGNGVCVGCLADTDCTLPQICDEPHQTCVDPTCSDGERDGSETGIDCGGSCAPAQTCDPGESCGNPIDCSSHVCTAGVCVAPMCGDGVQQMGEACDDGNHTNGDGCDDGVNGTCRPTGCGNGVMTGTEVCDDGNATNGDGCDNNCTVSACGNRIVAPGEGCDDGGTTAGDGCSATCAIEAGYTCSMQPSVCVTTCGDGVRAGTEQCDDGGTATGDGCSTTCTVEAGFTCSGTTPSTCTAICGDNLLLGAEQCDDGGVAAGDGCSPTCTFEVTCAPGTTLFQVRSTDVPVAIPDANTVGVDSMIVLPAADQGAIRSVSVGIGRLDHTFDGDLSLSLVSPTTRTRSLIARRGSSGDNFVTTRLDDAATTLISAGSAPFTGRFRPEETLSDAAGYYGQNALKRTPTGPNGTWRLHMTDSVGSDTGTLRGWTLSLCVDTTVYCGNGVIDAGEQCDDANFNDSDACTSQCRLTNGCGDGDLDPGELCDDGNLVSGDGCSATCGFDMTCNPGEQLVTVTNGAAFPIPDNNPVGAQSPVTVNTVGSVRKLGVFLGHISHTSDADLDIFLISPAGRTRELSTDNGSTGQDYLYTLLDDGATTAVTAGTASFIGRFRPESSLSTTAGVDFLGLNAAGTWKLQAADDANGATGTLLTWTLGMCVDAAAGYCGDGVTGAGEQCDDGNAVDNDACTNLCVANCGNGTIQPAEECDDGNQVNGDGCSSSCVVDIGCAAGETALVVSSSAATPLPDNDPAGALSTVNVPTAGAIHKAAVFVNLTHPADADVDLYLVSPRALTRELSTDNGGAGANYTRTYFDDSAASPVTGGTAPFTGRFRPEQSLATSSGLDYRDAGAAGDWALRAADDTATSTGTLNGWKLALCIDPAAPYCGDGTVNGTEQCDDANTNDNDGCSNQCRFPCGNNIIDPGEQCDDGNLVSGDGCSSTCTVDITCAPGQTPVIVSNPASIPIPDNDPSGALSPVSVSTIGGVKKAVVFVPSLTHPIDADVDMFLIAPNGVTRELSTDNGGTGSNYRGTYFDDGAATIVTGGAVPFTGHFRPEQSLATTAGADDLGQNAAGAWTLKVADDAAANTGTLDGWYLTMCVDTASYCGDGVPNGAEECDDGNTNNVDACSNLCVNNCGNGAINTGEECDDGNRTNGDGCSSTCGIEVTCGAGETRVFVDDNVAMPIPDNSPATGIQSPVVVGATGAVTKVTAYIRNITHTFDGDLLISLVSPAGVRRNLSNRNGSSNDNYVRTLFDDAAAATIASGSAPFTGRFRPDQSLTTTAGTDFRSLSATGTWNLAITDNANNDIGVLQSWAMVMCVDPAASYCGDGTVNGGEQCDDANTVDTDLCTNTCRLACGNGRLDQFEQCDDGNPTSGDGCSSSCTVDITCSGAQTPVIVSNPASFPIPDNNAAGVLSPVTVAPVGAVKKMVVVVPQITHPSDAEIDMFLLSPAGVQRELSTDNGSSANYANTFFDDAAATAVTSGSSPFSGHFRPEQSLTTTNNVDYLNLNAAGVWNLKVADDTTNNTGTLGAWYLTMCVDTAAPYCGNGVTDPGEECDDGNANDTDLCSNRCLVADGCGDGNLDAGEQCDDDNVVSGDGCSSACQVDITCGAGLTPVVVSNPTSFPIPDNNAAGVLSPVSGAPGGAVKKAVVVVQQITHASDAHIDMFLVSPGGVTRELSTDNGSGANYVSTFFDDAAATAVTSGSSPFTGRFRPEQSLTTTANVDDLNVNAAGTWNLKVADDTTGTTGTLVGWHLAMCVDTAAPYCGNGVIDTGEECDDANVVDTDACSNRCQIVDGCGDGNIDAGKQCDDDNLVSGDGCSSTCQVDITCSAGQTPVIVSNTTSFPIPDNNAAGVLSPVTVVPTGALKKAVVVVQQITHANDAHIDMFLVAPSGTTRELSTDNGSGANYVSTIFDDAAATAVTSGSSPFTGRFRPEQSLTATATVDYLNINSAGTWNLKVADDTTAITGTLIGWHLAMCVDTAAPYCGNGVTDPGEECDDGNAVNTDACTNLCGITDGCGDGNLDVGEVCDDDNTVSGDGCSSTCQPDIACGPGEVPVQLTNPTSTAIPDNAQSGVLVPISIPTLGVVRRVIPMVSVTHGSDGEVDMWLVSPYGTERELSTDQSGVNYRSTIFTDTAITAITAGTAPYSGAFRPEQTISNPAGFANQTATGTWYLRIADDTSLGTGTLDSWTLALCVDPSVPSVCGNGYVEPGETCDDGNGTAGDGCSPTCQVELTCPTGSPVYVRSSDTPRVIPDNNTTGVTTTIAVGATGTIDKAVVVLDAVPHTFPGDLIITLTSPAATTVTLSSRNGGTGDDFVSTIFDDAGATAITSITATGAPFRARYQPQSVLSAVNGQSPTGGWTLKTVDAAGSDGGLVSGWTLGLCVH